MSLSLKKIESICQHGIGVLIDAWQFVPSHNIKMVGNSLHIEWSDLNSHCKNTLVFDQSDNKKLTFDHKEKGVISLIPCVNRKTTNGLSPDMISKPAVHANANGTVTLFLVTRLDVSDLVE